MANIFKNAATTLTQAEQIIYTCPENSVANIHTVFFCNRSNNENIGINLKFGDKSERKEFYILKNTPLCYNTSFNLERTITLEENDYIMASCTLNSVADCIICMLITDCIN